MILDQVSEMPYAGPEAYIDDVQFVYTKYANRVSLDSVYINLTSAYQFKHTKEVSVGAAPDSFFSFLSVPESVKLVEEVMIKRHSQGLPIRSLLFIAKTNEFVKPELNDLFDEEFFSKSTHTWVSKKNQEMLTIEYKPVKTITFKAFTIAVEHILTDKDIADDWTTMDDPKFPSFQVAGFETLIPVVPLVNMPWASYLEAMKVTKDKSYVCVKNDEVTLPIFVYQLLMKVTPGSTFFPVVIGDEYPKTAVSSNELSESYVVPLLAERDYIEYNQDTRELVLKSEMASHSTEMYAFLRRAASILSPDDITAIRDRVKEAQAEQYQLLHSLLTSPPIDITQDAMAEFGLDDQTVAGGAGGTGGNRSQQKVRGKK